MSPDGIDFAVFDHIVPAQFIYFTFPNPLLPSPENPYAGTLRVSVADSPSSKSKFSPPAIAALLVPHRREDDWVFSTTAGHFQLLRLMSSFNLSIYRLVLIGDLPSSSDSLPRPYSRTQPECEGKSLDSFKGSLMPLLFALCPKAAFVNGMPSIPFLGYEDGLIRCNPVEKAVGLKAGEMLVEDVEIEVSNQLPELRRCLRFKRMPNLIQTQVRLLHDSVDVDVVRPEMGSLVQPYLGLMLSALFLNGPAIEEDFRSGHVPSILCVGVGGGALVTALRLRFGFRVLGVEKDEVVLSVARRHFGLFEDDLLKVLVYDGLLFIKDYCRGSSESNLFHAIMVDLDEEDPVNGMGAPPAKFLHLLVIAGARMALHLKGILVVNVIPSDESLYARMIKLLRRFFCELYELKVEDSENFVIIATASPIGSDVKNMKKEGGIYEKLKELDCERFIGGIKKI